MHLNPAIDRDRRIGHIIVALRNKQNAVLSNTFETATSTTVTLANARAFGYIYNEEGINNQVANIEQTMHGRFETINGQLATVNASVNGRFQTMDGRLHTIEGRLNTMEETMEGRFGEIQAALDLLLEGRDRAQTHPRTRGGGRESR